jgi:hypothetical protein
MVRYSFPAGLLHPLQHAGLSRRSGLPHFKNTEGEAQVARFAGRAERLAYFYGYMQLGLSGDGIGQGERNFERAGAHWRRRQRDAIY